MQEESTMFIRRLEKKGNMLVIGLGIDGDSDAQDVQILSTMSKASYFHVGQEVEISITYR